MGASYDGNVQLHESDEAETAVLSELFESLESADDLPTFGDGPSASAFISKPEFELSELMPDGPYTLRILGQVYDQVYSDLLMELLTRGLLAGADIWRAPSWIPFVEHPDFGAIQAQMTEELERVVERKRPRELTPQPHWNTIEEFRRTDEVTQPHVHRDDIFGDQTSESLEQTTDASGGQDSEAYDDTRKTAEFDSEPFREFAAQLSAPTQRLAPEEVPSQPEITPPENPFRAEAPTDVSQPVHLAEVDEDVIETREGASLLLRTEVPTRERPSPLEGSKSPATQFPTLINAGQGGCNAEDSAPPSAVLKPARRKRPTASIPRPLMESATEPESSEEVSRIPGWLVFVAATAIVFSAIAIAVLAVTYWTNNADAAPQTAVPPVARAASMASLHLHSALPHAFTDGRDAAAVAATLDADGPRKVYVLESLHAARPTAENALEAGRANLEIREWKTARDYAVRALQLGASVSDARGVFEASVQRDKSFRLPTSETLSATSIESAKFGVNTILVQVAGEGPGTFVPSLQSEPDSFRPHLALTTLCEVVECPFSIARTRRVLLRRSSLEQALLEAPREGELRVGDLRWATSAEGEVVEGALIVPSKDTAPFPIAQDDLWRPWLLAGSMDASSLQAMRESIGMKARAPSEVAAEVRPQLSALLTIDFLVNNWGRIPDEPRATTGWRDGQLVSLRHEAAFATRSSRRVAGRFGWVEVFDRDLIARLRLLTPEAVDPLLFDADDPISQARRDEFWRQHEELLEAVEDAELRNGDAIWL